ncbi:cytochrome c-type biogenesis protein CcmH [Amorphus suaedae]
MVFWVSVAILTGMAVLAVLWPLSRRQPGPDDAPHDVAVYRDQLGEVDRDVERGLIAPGEAEAARAEIARRLLRADREAGAASTTSRNRRRVVALAAIVAVPLISLLVYGTLGRPTYPDQPRAARLQAPAGDETLSTLVARVEDHLSKNPDDGRGWDVLGPVYLRLGRPADASAAFTNAIRLQGQSAERLAGLGEAIVQANGGVVTDDATAAFQAANDLDPTAANPRFFLALGLSQEGKTEEAIAAWNALIASASGGEPWLPVARRQVAALGGEPAEAPAAMPGPGRADVEAAAGMTDEDRQAMIEGMVSQLATRLDSSGGSVDEWLRLIRAYQVLGRTDEAKAAAARATEAFSEDPEAQARIRSIEDEIGLNQ